MSNNQSWNSIGEEIRSAVEEALKTGDFTNFGNTVSSSVAEAMKAVQAKVEYNVNGTVNTSNKTYTQQMAEITRERKLRQMEIEERNRKARLEAIRARAPFKAIGKVSSILYKVFGGIGAGVFGTLAFIFLLIGIGEGFFVPFLVFLIFTLGFAAMIGTGVKQKKRLNKALKFYKLAGNNHYINIDELALHLGTTRKNVLKDIKKFLNMGFYPQGHLDAAETCFMLDDKIYGEYISIEKQRRAMAREQLMRETPTGSGIVAAEAAAKENISELDKMIAEGEDCIKRLREMNDNISGEEISSKLFRLESLLKEIFEQLRLHPEKLPTMQKFMNYYLPTTLKLVGAYEQFDTMVVQGDDVKDAKAEIEKTLDTINDAFVELLNRMVRDTAYDVATDAQVLATMLAQEGLTKSGFESSSPQ